MISLVLGPVKETQLCNGISTISFWETSAEFHLCSCLTLQETSCYCFVPSTYHSLFHQDQNTCLYTYYHCFSNTQDATTDVTKHRCSVTAYLTLKATSAWALRETYSSHAHFYVCISCFISLSSYVTVSPA